MGALTVKASAYQFRPWEVTPVEVFDHLAGSGRVVLHLRGGRTLAASRPGWLLDRTRFLYDGFRRQRLTAPLAGGTPVGWPTAVAVFASTLAGGNFYFRVDPEGVHFFWLLRGYNALRDGRTPRVPAALDVAVRSVVYHGVFGLRPVEAALALPGVLTYEEEGVMTPPAGAVSLFLVGALVPQLLRGRTQFGWSALGTPPEETPRAGNRALFQVSPVQKLLPGW